MKYLAVIHGWHVSSNGFDVHELEATEKNAAYNEAYGLKSMREKTFDKCAVEVIAIEDGQALANRKLTLKERLTGRINL